MKLRLDKYLADMGIGTRTEVKKAITKGQVRVNEETVKRPEIKIDTEKDHVFYQGQMVAYAEYEYYMLNKPAVLIVIQQLFALLQEEGQPLLLLAGDFFRIQDLVCTVDIRRIK